MDYCSEKLKAKVSTGNILVLLINIGGFKLNNRHLFLFGGSPPFSKKFGEQFATIAKKSNGKIAILFLERDGWETYMSKYTVALEEHGIDNIVYLPLSQKTNNQTLAALKSCRGIIIGGGKTELYRSYIVDTKIGEMIKELYWLGVPVAGFSAGALISPEHCVIPPIDNSQNKHLFLKGLGLIKDCVVSVHYTKWQEKSRLIEAVKKLNVTNGFGIDDKAAIYFVNESLKETEGEEIHQFKNAK